MVLSVEEALAIGTMRKIIRFHPVAVLMLVLMLVLLVLARLAEQQPDHRK
jgi:hypothetical protein